MLSSLELDNTKRETFSKCPYRYDLTFNRGIVPARGSTALRYGIVFHAGMEGFYSHIKEQGWTRDGKALERAADYAKESWEEQSKERTFFEDYRTFDNLVRALFLYIDHFAMDEQMLKVLESERVFKINMGNGLYFTGRLDIEMLLSGQRWINEFKTTGRTIPYVSSQQARSFQFVGYFYAMKKIYGGKAPEGILVTYHQLSAYKSKTTGEYGAPKILFDRIPLFFTDQDMADWEQSFRYTASLILTCMTNETWPKQFDSCHLYGSCPYLFLCEQKRPRGNENLATEYVIREPWNVLNTPPRGGVVEI